MLFFSMSQYLLVPSMNCSSLLPAALMQPYGLSSDRLIPHLHPFKLCSNAGSTHISISQTQLLDMTLSTCTQLLWSTMARPVLSGICPVKPLYGLGHCAAAQSTPSLCRATILFLRSSESSLPWGAMLKCQWLVWESESDNTKFNTIYLYIYIYIYIGRQTDRHIDRHIDR